LSICCPSEYPLLIPNLHPDIYSDFDFISGQWKFSDPSEPFHSFGSVAREQISDPSFGDETSVGYFE
jgi:hypothetical protein